MLRVLREILRGPGLADLAPGLERIVREVIELYSPSEVILAGSLARGEFVRGLSDIDLLVIVDYDVSDEKRFTLRAVEDVDVEITVVSRKELEQAISSGNMFYAEALRHGIKIYVAPENVAGEKDAGRRDSPGG